MLRERLSNETDEVVIPKPYNGNNIWRACCCIIICIILPLFIYIFIYELKQAWINIFNQL